MTFEIMSWDNNYFCIRDNDRVFGKILSFNDIARIIYPISLIENGIEKRYGIEFFDDDQNNYDEYPDDCETYLLFKDETLLQKFIDEIIIPKFIAKKLIG